MIKILQSIFSITNEQEQNVLRFLGFKIKVRNLKLENKIQAEKITKLNKKINKLTKQNKYYLDAIKTNPEMFEIYIKNPELKAKDEKRAPLVRTEITELLNTKPYPIFRTIEIETLNKCNGECQFCPVNRFDDPREFKMMDDELFYNIISQLKELKYKGRVQLFSNNEPLMDKRIFDFAKYAKEELKECHFSLFTNGTLLDLDKFKKLIIYFDTFGIDIYYDTDEKIPENIKPIISYCLQNPELQNKVKIQLINKAAIRNNRGGKSKNRKNLYTLQTPCLLPFIQVIVRPTGELSLCCNDATGVFTLGDLRKDKLIDIWNGNYYNEIRQKLKSNREQVEMCKLCDNFGGFGPNSSSEYVFKPEEFKKCWDYVKLKFSD